MSEEPTLWILYDSGGRDDPAEVYGVFTSEEKAKRAAAHCDPRGYTSIDAVLVDALYKADTGLCGSANVFSYPQPTPDTGWDHMVVEGCPAKLAVEAQMRDTPSAHPVVG